MGLAGKSRKRLLQLATDKNVVDDAIDMIRSSYENLPGLEFQKVWLFQLLHRERFHVAPVAYRLSFGVWPRLPYTNRRILSLAAGLPASVTYNRYLEEKLLISKFPELASLPLDRNSNNTRPLLPSLNYRLKEKTINRFIKNIIYGNKIERRFWYNASDINQSDWIDLRKLFEKYRNSVPLIFSQNQLDELIPSPAKKITSANSIRETAGLKTLMMLTILLGCYLD